MKKAILTLSLLTSILSFAQEQNGIFVCGTIKLGSEFSEVGGYTLRVNGEQAMNLALVKDIASVDFQNYEAQITTDSDLKDLGVDGLIENENVCISGEFVNRTYGAIAPSKIFKIK